MKCSVVSADARWDILAYFLVPDCIADGSGCGQQPLGHDQMEDGKGDAADQYGVNNSGGTDPAGLPDPLAARGVLHGGRAGPDWCRLGGQQS